MLERTHSLASHTTLSRSTMKHEVCGNPVVLPLSRDNTGGVFVDGECRESSLLFRHYGGTSGPTRIVSPGDATAPVRHIHEEAIFAGYLFDHFGHFLLESLSRLWITRQYPTLRLVWCGRRDPRSPIYKAWQREILTLLGVENEPLFVDVPLQFDRLLIPEPGYVIQTTFHPEHAEFLAVVAPSNIVPEKRCWLSRSKLPVDRGGTRHEEHLEARLQANGWSIFRPEEYSVRDQLAFLSSSHTIAGFTGSAFHSLILLTDLKSELRLIAARPPNANYTTIASVKGFRQEITAIPSTIYSRGRLAAQDQVILPNFGKVLDALDVPIAGLAAPRRETYATHRINAIAEYCDARSYLEVGVGDGDTFLNVDIEEKTGIDEALGFDGRAVSEDPRISLFEMTAHDYFTRFAGHARFDIVFLNRVYLAEEALRSFCGSLGFSHEETIWIINNTVPSDVYSSSRDRDQAIRSRQNSGDQGCAWHGDVYKIVAFLYEFFPSFSYVTINTGGNPQTIVWRAARTEHRPLGLTVEAVGQLSYLEVVTRQQVMQLCSEGDGLRTMERVARTWNAGGSAP